MQVHINVYFNKIIFVYPLFDFLCEIWKKFNQQKKKAEKLSFSNFMYMYMFSVAIYPVTCV